MSLDQDTLRHLPRYDSERDKLYEKELPVVEIAEYETLGHRQVRYSIIP